MLNGGLNTGLEKFFDAFTNARDRRDRLDAQRAALAGQQERGAKDDDYRDRKLALDQDSLVDARKTKIEEAALTRDASASEKQKDRDARMDVARLMDGSKTERQSSKQSSLDKAIDETIGKSLGDFELTGGAAAVDTDLATLSGISSRLSDKNQAGEISGRSLIGLLPTSIQKIVAPDMAAAQQQSSSVAMKSVKALLGAQPTEQDRIQIEKNAYDPAMSAQENIRKIDAMTKTISAMRDAKVAMVAYARENKTMRGYTGPTPQSALHGSSREEPTQGGAAAPMSFEEWKKANVR